MRYARAAKKETMKPIPNKVLSSPSPSPNSKNQAKSSEVLTRFSPFATGEIKQYHGQKKRTNQGKSRGV
jgi:hypothetical protein